MENITTITGNIVSGVKKGAFFTNLEWVQEQCQTKLGFKPYAGTLNLEIDEQKIPFFEALWQQSSIELVSPDSNFCNARVYPVSVMGVSGAVVAPAEDVRAHAKNIIEIIAPISLKEALDVDDGDSVFLTIETPE